MPVSSYPGPESIHRHKLPNGITVLGYENPTTESIVVEGLIRAGSLVESPGQAGTANFTAEMLMRGTENRSFEQIYEAIESVGASLGFGSGRHVTEFSGTCLVEDIDLVLELLADSIRRPIFPQDQIEPVRGEIMTGLHIRANDTRFRASQAFRELLYPDHPYSQTVDGYLETVANISADDIGSFHRDYFGPSGMIITLVGSLDFHEILENVEAVFGDWHKVVHEMPLAPDADQPADIIRQFVPMPDKSQSDIVLGLPGPRRSAPDYLEASIANTILGVFGMMGRLGQSVREEQGLAYYAYSRLQGGLGPSPWIVSTGVDPQNVERAISSVIKEIDRLLTEPIPIEELDDTKAFRTGSLPVGLETNDGLAGVITDMEFYELGLNYLHELPGKINGMTVDAVQQAAGNYLSVDNLAIAIAGPNEENNSNG
jgi:zinc protease